MKILRRREINTVLKKPDIKFSIDIFSVYLLKRSKFSFLNYKSAPICFVWLQSKKKHSSVERHIYKRYMKEILKNKLNKYIIIIMIKNYISDIMFLKTNFCQVISKISND